MAESVCRTKKLFNKQVIDPRTNKPKEGDDGDLGSCIMRFSNGYLHSRFIDGQQIPAVEYNDFHMEYYEYGVLHRTDGPALVSDYGKINEYWEHGNHIRTERPIG